MTIDKSKWIKSGELFSPLKVDILSSENGSSGIPSLFASGDAIMSSLWDPAQESLAEGCL